MRSDTKQLKQETKPLEQDATQLCKKTLNCNVDARHKPEESDEKSEEIDMWILREGDLKQQK